MSSLGGRWPKKLRNLDGFLAAGHGTALGDKAVGEGGSESALSGLCTPRPLRMLIALARLVVLLVWPGVRCLLLMFESGLLLLWALRNLRTVNPFCRAG